MFIFFVFFFFVGGGGGGGVVSVSWYFVTIPITMKKKKNPLDDDLSGSNVLQLAHDILAKEAFFVVH